jgi:hypothetical protein
MALQLNEELSNGTSGNYWSIGTLNISETSTRVYLTLHVSKEAKDSGKTPLREISKTVKHTKNEVMTGNVYEFMYNKIKELDEFNSAMDV